MQARLFILLAYLGLRVRCEVKEDLVTEIPGFNAPNFKVYSGYLFVNGPINGYDSLSIHYQFCEAQVNPSTGPVVAWHSGGPGGSSIAGEYTMMGFFRVSDELKINPHAWNRIANMLYLESPAGSGQENGYSTCIKGGKPVTCSWNDVTQAEAYAHTLVAFFKAFPEFLKNSFYISGESYFGQYGPNIAHRILRDKSFSSINLKGLLVGNGCWGGDSTSVSCTGPHSDRNDLDNLFGKGMISKKKYKLAYEACGFSNSSSSLSASSGCDDALSAAHAEVGPYNPYEVYDNCPQIGQYLQRSGKDMRWVMQQMRAALLPSSHSDAKSNLLQASGGYSWDCGSTLSNDQVNAYLTRKDVRMALHLDAPGQSKFSYTSSGPASITLYPYLAKRIRVLIYNGDADTCIPYNGNEEWLEDLVQMGVLQETDSWKPWFVPNVTTPAAGAISKYNVVGSDQILTFVTIRLAGHMVPLFRPDAALQFFEAFLEAELNSTVETRSLVYS